jgi:hypothetical protein
MKLMNNIGQSQVFDLSAPRFASLAFAAFAMFSLPVTVSAQQTIASPGANTATTVSYDTAQPSPVESGDGAAQTGAASQSSVAPAATGFSGFVSRYQARVTAIQAEQPHWVTPLVLVTPRLEQELRTDFVRQVGTNLYTTWNLGNTKGLEFIPERHTEIILNIPPFIDHTASKQKDGFGDFSVLAKERIFSRNEEQGNAIVTAFLAASVPTGKNGNGRCCAVITPTLAGGKGFGLFAYSSTLGGSLPVSNSKGLGHTITWNNSFQYRLATAGPARLFWPEVEFNSSYFKGGSNDGKSTTYATPGIIVGRVPLSHDATGKTGRLGLTFGLGEQIAVSQFHSNNHDLIFTARLPF